MHIVTAHAAGPVLLSQYGTGEEWDRLGLELLSNGEPSLALAAFSEAQALTPASLSFALHVVEAACACGQTAAALDRTEAACDRDPLDPVAPVMRGVLLDRLGQREAAIDALMVAYALAPDSAAAAMFLGGLLARANRLKEAERALAAAAELDPDNAMVRNDRAAVLIRLHRHADARRLLLDVTDSAGPPGAVSSNLVTATMCLGLQEEAIGLAWDAVAHDPSSPLQWRGLCNALPYCFGIDGPALLATARTCSNHLARTTLPEFTNNRDPDRPLVIGLMSGTLRTHPVGWLTVAGFEALDRTQFELICLGDGGAANDTIQRRFKSIASDWHETAMLDDIRLAMTARTAGIDILVDLGGYGDAARMQACAHRLAPVQIKWVGMQNHSTGLREMDWFMTDRWETPPALEHSYSERMLRLPDGYICYTPPPYAPAVMPPPAVRNGYVTFGCFNNLAKVTTAAIGTWAEIMRLLPGSRLVLKTHQFSDPETAARMRQDFAECGIDPIRIEPRGPSPHRDLLAGYNDIDIVLDPFPYAGGLTTCEALWMGVPTVALAGETFSARHSTSHLSNTGLPDWIATNIDDYIGIAVAKASDLPCLTGLRAGLREQVRTSPLCDATRFGAHLGLVLRHAWRDWCGTENM